MDWTRMRLWQVPFAIHQAIDMLPHPTVLVEEHQKTPDYRMDGRLRADCGGQLVITLSGRGGLRIGDRHYRLTTGRAFLHVHYDPQITYYYPLDGKDDWRFLWIEFAGGGVDTLIGEINRRYGYLFDVPPGSPTMNLLWSYKNRKGELQVMPPLEAAQLVYNILGKVCAAAEQEARCSSQSALIAEVQEFICTELSSGINVKTIARKFHLSREHLSRSFTAQTGCSPQNYLQRERMRAAVDMLLQTRLPGKEIAARCGFSSYAVFYRAFSKYFSRTPRELRNSKYRPEIP